MNTAIRPAHIALLSGLLLILAAHLAWLLNLGSEDVALCLPYWDGISVLPCSRWA